MLLFFCNAESCRNESANQRNLFTGKYLVVVYMNGYSFSIYKNYGITICRIV